MNVLNIFLNFNGNLEDAFDFYKEVFNGNYKVLKKYKEMPHADTLTEEDQNKVMHCELDLNNGIILMGCDILEAWGQSITHGNNFYLNITPSNINEGSSIFNKLSNGGVIQMPFQKTFWGPHFGTVTDKFGTQWMVKLED